MSDHETELSEALGALRPSEASRARGMGAAMAAFDAEFADQTERASQGLGVDARPTGKARPAVGARVPGASAMRAITSFFTLPRGAVMAGGTCATAVLAALLVYRADPALYDITAPMDAPAAPVERTEAAAPAEETAEAEIRTPVASDPVTESATETPVAPEVALEPIPAPAPMTDADAAPAAPPPPPAIERSKSADTAAPDAPRASGGITSISELLVTVSPDAAESDTPTRERAPEYRATLSAEPSARLHSGEATATAAMSASPETIVVTGSRIAKDSEVVERDGRLFRRAIKTPARTVERVTPALTRTETRRVENPDGSVSTVTEEVVVQEASTELVMVPPEYELVPIEREPEPLPQSGQLTAGDYDDVLNPDLYKIYVDRMLQGELRGKSLPYVDADRRVGVRVTDRRGRPVPLATVTVRAQDGSDMFPVRTGADGMAYLYPAYDGLEAGMRLSIEAPGARAVTRTLSGRVIDTGGEVRVRLSADAAPVSQMDLLLTIDATGSMGDELRYLQSELRAILERVEAAHPGIDIRTGLVVYRDVGDQYVVREVPFTADMESFQAALAQQTANGGGDMPEAMHSAMEAGLGLDWRDGALKVNLLVADAPPHDRHIAKTWETALLSRTQGVHIVPIAASGVDKTAEFLMRGMAQITGGRFLFLTDDSGIGNPHAEPTVDCYVVTRLDGLVTRVLESLISGERVEPEPDAIIRSVGDYDAGVCAVDGASIRLTGQ